MCGSRPGSEVVAGEPVELASLQRQDPAAFEAMHRATAPELRGYLARLCRTPDQVDDLLQETFRRAYAALPTTAPDTRVRAWLFAIATNVVRSAARTAYWRRVIPTDDRELDRRPAAGAGPEERAEAVDLIERTLAALKPDHAALLLLHWHAGFTIDELAPAQGVARETIKKRLYRARKAFSAAYARELSGLTDGRGGAP